MPRRKGFANPISLFVNVEEACAAIVRHAGRQGRLPEPDTIDPEHWVYDIGENGDLSVDAALGGGVREMIHLFRDIPNDKASFATKAVNRGLLDYDPRGKTRIRFSLMPARIARGSVPASDVVLAVLLLLAAAAAVLVLAARIYRQ